VSERALTARVVAARLESLGDPRDAAFYPGYFKTGPGEYGEGDRFLGIRAPVVRQIAKEAASLPLAECRKLLRSPFNEVRATALLILVRKYQRGDDEEREKIFRLYLAGTKHINNWNLVDVSAPAVVGEHLLHRSRAPLRKLARSKSLWERRIAIIATQTLIRNEDYDETFRIADLLLEDEHDLIHKAAGWMIREVGNRDRARAEAFLKPRYARMPRTMLRYAIEKYPEPLRKRYLRGDV
jgi:3-methyladenine DNA glycosylase AlkD